MSRTSLVLAAIGLFACFTLTQAADPSDKSSGKSDSGYVTTGEFNQKIGQLQDQIAELKQLLVANSKPPAPAAGTPAGNPQNPPELAGPLVKIPTLEERVGKLENELGSLKNRVSEQDYVVKDLTKVGAGGLVILNPENRVLWQGVSEQLRHMAPQTGTLLVQNNMLTPQYLRINGELHAIPAMNSIEFTVPVGTISTELPNYEAPKNWMIGAPDYRQTIIINPRPNPVVSYPIYEPEPWWPVYP
jgi:hypothetical protein